jgi:hypothetical protein
MTVDLDPTLTMHSEAPPAAHCSRFCVGGVSVQLSGDHGMDVDLGSALEPFRVAPGISDMNIRVSWTASLGRAKDQSALFDSGSAWRLHKNETGFQFDFSAEPGGENPYKRLLIDEQFREASLLLSERSFAQFGALPPMGYPLDEVLMTHRLAHEKAIELHGVGIVGPEGSSNLFIGHSGAGKSTTAQLWTSLHNVKVLSDDRIIVREDASQIFMYGTPWHGEAEFALPERSRLQRIFILEHGVGNVLTRLSKSQAVAELFARSFVPFHHHQYVDSALNFLERVADEVPCYRYLFEPDERAVDKIIHFHD